MYVPIQNFKTLGFQVVNFSWYFYSRIGDMGEFSTVFAIRSILEKQPSICIRGIKLQHLKAALKELDIDFGKEDAEMDIVTINFNKDKMNILFGECKVKIKMYINMNSNSGTIWRFFASNFAFWEPNKKNFGTKIPEIRPRLGIRMNFLKL